jgi:hypothetical protein
MALRIIESGARISGIKTSAAEYIIPTENLETLSVHAVYTVASAAAKTFASATDVNIVTNVIQSSAHGFVTGRKIALTTAGVLPTGLSATNYYVIRIDADSLQLATSLANAEAGGAVDITAIGTGTHTMTPAAITGGNIKLQESSAYHPVDNPTGSFVDISGSTAAITGTSESIFKPDVRCAYVKIKFDLTDGQVDINAYTCGKAYS